MPRRDFDCNEVEFRTFCIVLRRRFAVAGGSEGIISSIKVASVERGVEILCKNASENQSKCSLDGERSWVVFFSEISATSRAVADSGEAAVQSCFHRNTAGQYIIGKHEDSERWITCFVRSTE